MHHMAAPGAGFAPGIEDRHRFDAVGRGALDIFIQLPELIAHALHVLDEFREVACQLQVTAVTDAVDGLAQDSPAGGDPVLFRLPDRVASLVEGVREEVGQETSLGVRYAGNVRDQAQGGTVAHRTHHRVQADGLKLVHIGLGADPVVAQEHHGLFAQFMGDVHHLLGQLGHLPALEGTRY